MTIKLEEERDYEKGKKKLKGERKMPIKGEKKEIIKKKQREL